MRRIHITESQLVQLSMLNEADDTASSVNGVNGVNQGQTGTNQVGTDGTTKTVTNGDGYTATKNADGTGTITVPKTDVNDKTEITSMLKQGGLNPNNTTVITDVNGNGDISNIIPTNVPKNTFLNPSKNQTSILNAKKEISQNPNGIAPSASYNSLMRESKFITKKDLNSFRVNYLRENSLMITKGKIKDFLK